MKAMFVGVKKPYHSEKTGKTYFNAVFATQHPDAPNCIETLDVDATPQVHAQLLGHSMGELLDLDVSPRMFAGKVQGLTVTGIN